ncbi:hypothetical protein [Mesorhizobium sp. 2RAF21]|uniref:hypothetical protein n=1 Tax=Mesorhizobium sp. 2RAF21 TaxID=3232995 RepID=UPI003F9661C7
MSRYPKAEDGERFTVDERAKQAPVAVMAAYEAVVNLGWPKRGQSNWKAWNAMLARLNEQLAGAGLAPVTYSMFDGWARAVLRGKTSIKLTEVSCDHPAKLAE